MQNNVLMGTYPSCKVTDIFRKIKITYTMLKHTFFSCYDTGFYVSW